MKVGYARVSTVDQNLDLQIDALKGNGCEQIFQDKFSGVTDKRKGLEEALQYVRSGDTLMVWRLTTIPNP
ncbi:Resolvase, N terminal domain [Seinonella peptonophila]|uniref:Resolvase, N terminal domain n=1 Tax=Seinonella peptonophila TaxID=112248 RepID=A0A1M5BG90_9BACL|nr:Resolvase, N terminal domain [Seinonella peptonophila]